VFVLEFSNDPAPFAESTVLGKCTFAVWTNGMRYVGLERLLGSLERSHNSLPVAVQNDQIPLIVHFADLVRNTGHGGRHFGYFVAPIP
jgi:hypothetical protein